MSVAVPISAGDLKTFVKTVTDHTRPVTDPEMLEALNYGYDKAIKAVLAVRTQVFLSFTDSFTLVGGQQDYDIGAYDPPLYRPTRLLVGSATVRAIKFRYKALTDNEFEAQESSRAGTAANFFYDVLEGLFPGTATTSTAASATTVTVASAAGIVVGTLLQILGSGTNQTLPGGATIPTTYYGVVRGIVGNVLTMAPAFTAQPVNGTTITPMRQRLLRLAPAPGDSVTGRLYYQYRPAKLVALTDYLDPIVAEHRAVIEYFAISQLLRSVNDAEASQWFQEAQQLRSELIQEIDPLSGQNSEALGTDLGAME